MIYTKDLLLQSIRNVDESIHTRLLDHTIGMKQALDEAAVLILLHAEAGEYGYTRATYDGMKEYHASVRVITEALYQLKGYGYLSYGSQEEFTEKELLYGTHICRVFTVSGC